MKRTASATWRGSGLEGSGSLSTQSGVFDAQPYSAKTRFQNEDGKLGTNPEELIAAAHAGCFAMALSFGLTGAGHPPVRLSCEATLTMEKDDAGWAITAIALDLEGEVDGVSEAEFREAAQAAKAGCPVSRALNAEITLNARLVS